MEEFRFTEKTQQELCGLRLGARREDALRIISKTGTQLSRADTRENILAVFNAAKQETDALWEDTEGDKHRVICALTEMVHCRIKQIQRVTEA